jgi:hypothetical protein
MWDEALRFEPECADVSVSIVPVTQFYRQPEETFVSNIFVKTLSNFPEGYNIIEVTHTTRPVSRPRAAKFPFCRAVCARIPTTSLWDA